MSNSAVVYLSVSELKKLISDVRRTGSNIVRVEVEEPDDNGYEGYIAFTSYNSHTNSEWHEFEELFELPEYKELEKAYNERPISEFGFSDNLV